MKRHNLGLPNWIIFKSKFDLNNKVLIPNRQLKESNSKFKTIKCPNRTLKRQLNKVYIIFSKMLV